MAVNDDIRSALASYEGFSINTRVYNFLGSLGYTGSLSDRLSKYRYKDREGWQALLLEFGRFLRGGETLQLDFVEERYASKSLDDSTILYSSDASNLLTVQRASPKWVYDETGTLVEVPVDALAIQHNPLTGESRGALIEESRTNLLTWSEDFRQWQSLGLTVEQSEVVAPDGTTSVDRLVEGTGSDFKYARKGGGSPADNTVLAFSVLLKAAEIVEARIGIRVKTGAYIGGYFNLANGTAVSVDGGVLDYAIEGLSDGWFRVSVVVNIGSDAANISSLGIVYLVKGGELSYTGDGTSGIYVWGAQLEEGSTPSSYIPTEDAPVTRATDNVYRTLGDEFNPMEGTFYGEFSSWEVGVQSAVFTLGNRDNNIRVFKVSSGRVDAAIVKDGVTYDTITDAPNDNYLKWGFVYRADGTYALSLGGVIYEALDHLPDSPPKLAGETLNVGDNPFVGAIRNATGATYSSFRYTPRALSEAELIELTSQ